MKLSDEIKINLLKLPRKTIEEKLYKTSNIEVNLDFEELKSVYGAFVTLHIHKRLRGCIGNIEGYHSLKETIRNMAISSAFEDPRFQSLTAKEFDSVDIEITILSPLEDSCLEEIKPMIHGVVLSQGYRQSTFLPQVWEQLPDKDQFLSHLSMKAGLSSEAYKDPQTKFQTYTGLVFSEKEFKLI